MFTQFVSWVAQAVRAEHRGSVKGCAIGVLDNQEEKVFSPGSRGMLVGGSQCHARTGAVQVSNVTGLSNLYDHINRGKKLRREKERGTDI